MAWHVPSCTRLCGDPAGAKKIVFFLGLEWNFEMDIRLFSDFLDVFMD